MTHDAAASRWGAGLFLALASAASFGTSGPVARGLLDTGWSAGAAVTARIALAALVLLVPGLWALRGRWQLLRTNAGLVGLYGALAVAGSQLCYFYAVSHLQVGLALLLEYTAPLAVVVWWWLRHGQRPGRLTVLGAAIEALGLVLLLGVLDGGAPDLHVVGVLWALGAMVGAAAYFVISADLDNGLPPLTLAASGLVVGALVLVAAALAGLLPMSASTAPVTYAGVRVAWFVPVLVLGVLAGALAYVTGIAAGRRLGSRLASFVALAEVVAAIGFAWLLLDELPAATQLAGGVLVLGGVVVVKLGEDRTQLAVEPLPVPDVGEDRQDGSAGVLPLEEDLAVQHQQRRGDRDGQQGADHSHQ